MKLRKSGTSAPLFYEKEILREFNFPKAPVYVPAGMTAEELLAIHKSAYNACYFRPSMILRKLGEIRSLNDVSILLKGGYSLLRNALFKPDAV